MGELSVEQHIEGINKALDTMQSRITRAVGLAVEREREACVEICNDWVQNHDNVPREGNAVLEVRNTIRARGTG